jgi:hypothetical protein
MSATTVRLLKAASEIAGGDKALAVRLGVDASTLRSFLDDVRQLPDSLLLRAVDIILADRHARYGPAAQRLPGMSEDPGHAG